MSIEKEWLAIIIGPYGGGSWARGRDMDVQIKRVCKIFKSDWKTLFKLPKGQEVKVVILDVTDRDHVYWDDFGFHDKDRGESFKPHSVVKAALP